MAIVNRQGERLDMMAERSYGGYEDKAHKLLEMAEACYCSIGETAARPYVMAAQVYATLAVAAVTWQARS